MVTLFFECFTAVCSRHVKGVWWGVRELASSLVCPPYSVHRFFLVTGIESARAVIWMKQVTVAHDDKMMGFKHALRAQDLSSMSAKSDVIPTLSSQILNVHRFYSSDLDYRKVSQGVIHAICICVGSCLQSIAFLAQSKSHPP